MTTDGMIIYWPVHTCQPVQKGGFLIGWYNVDSSICVASVVSNVKLHDLERLLSIFCVAKDSEFQHIDRVCKAPLKILGELVTESAGADHGCIPTYDLWISVRLDSTCAPTVLQHHVHGKRWTTDYEVLFYEQPNPKRLQFLALEPLELDISTDKLSVKQSDPVKDLVRKKWNETMERGRRLSRHAHEPSDDLAAVLVQINSSYYLEKGIQEACTELLRRTQTGPVSTLALLVGMGKQCVDKVTSVVCWHPLYMTYYYTKRVIMAPVICLLFVLFALANCALYVLNIRLPKFMLNAIALKDLSAAGQQVDLRLQQLYFWPRQYAMLRRGNWANTAEMRAHYTSFYNNMWLVANDIAIGVAFGAFLADNHQLIANVLHKCIHVYTVESLQSMMHWFLEYPAGLKLNRELGLFFSELFLWLIHIWTKCIAWLEPMTPHIIHAIGSSGIFGVSMIISLLSTLLAMMTLHLYCFYMVAARIFNWQITVLFSLFNLFRGKKHNVLRNRIDACDYDLDQLLLGTCLFTLLTFLFPTVLVYYLTFALGRVGVIFLQAIMEALLAFFNHFPLFAIMLRIKDPSRLPGGVQFDFFQQDDFTKRHWFGCFSRGWTLLRRWWKKETRRGRKRVVRFKRPPSTHSNGSTPSQSTYLWMRNLPIPFGAIFFQYMLLWRQLSAHYFSAYVFGCLLYGEPIKPVAKLQYPMLPDKRPSLETVWRILKSSVWDNTTDIDASASSSTRHPA